MFVANNTLHLMLISLPRCHDFQLNIKCVNNIILQNNKIMSILTNNSGNSIPNTLHLVLKNDS